MLKSKWCTIRDTDPCRLSLQKECRLSFVMLRAVGHARIVFIIPPLLFTLKIFHLLYRQETLKIPIVQSQK